MITQGVNMHILDTSVIVLFPWSLEADIVNNDVNNANNVWNKKSYFAISLKNMLKMYETVT